MRYLKKFNLFKEDINIDPADEPDIKMAKEEFLKFKSQIADFKLKKPKVDSVYLSGKENEDIKVQIENILGRDENNRNPFLVEYLHIMNLRRNVDSYQEQIKQDTISRSSLNDQLIGVTDETAQNAVKTKITDINTGISNKTKSIASLTKELNDADKSFKDKMSKIEKDMTSNIDKISNDIQK